MSTPTPTGNKILIDGSITDTMGPCMKSLGNDKMRAFVIALQDGPDLNYSRAAREAGYEGSDQIIWNQAYKLAHNPRVLEAIAEEAKRRLQASAGWSVSQLINLGQAAKADGDKQKALIAIMDRTGMGAKTTVDHNVNIRDDRTPAQMLAAIVQLSKQIGADPAVALKQLTGPVVDAEFAEVLPDDL